MHHDKTLAAMRALAEEIWPEDGTPVSSTDPSRSARRARQQRRLQGRIQRILFQALALADDPALAEADLAEVELESAGRAVRVRITGVADSHLAATAAWLQSELAAGLSRKRVPTVRVVGGAP